MKTMTMAAISTILLFATMPGLAEQKPSDTQQAEIEALKARLAELEEKVNEAQTKKMSALAMKSSDNRYNPGIGLILTGSATLIDPDDSEPQPVGFIMPEESGLPESGFSIGEAELNLTGNVDDKFYASATIAFGEGSAEVEEAYLQTLSMPGDVTLKFGRFLSGAGYLNGRHRHTDDFVQRPLVYDAFWGGGYGDDGVAAVWLAPTELFWEIGLEWYRGDAFAAVGGGHRGLGSKALFSHWGGDVGTSHSWRFGISWFDGHVDTREDLETDAAFLGDNQIIGFDFIWKWAPNGNPTHRNAKIQLEWFKRKRNGTFTQGTAMVDDEFNDAGGYIQGVYQWTRGWRLGVRYAFLSPDSTPAPLLGTTFDSGGHDPHRLSVMVDWSNSEYSRLRLQYSRDDSTPTKADVVILQYTMAFGAHPAHSF